MIVDTVVRVKNDPAFLAIKAKHMQDHPEAYGEREGDGGIQGWSTPSPYIECLIFCVGNNIGKESAFRAWAAEKGIGFKNLMGSYKGVSERSFLIAYEDSGTCQFWFRNEETVLHLSSMYRKNDKGLMQMFGARKATLLDPKGGKVADLGILRIVTPEYALKQDNWTLDISRGTYWTTEKQVS